MNATRREWDALKRVTTNALVGLLVSVPVLASDLKRDEVIVFYPTYAYPIAKGTQWEFEPHGCVSEPEQRAATLAVFREAIELQRNLNETENAIFAERARAFLADHERGKAVSIRLGDKIHPLGKSGADGMFAGRVRISAEEVENLRKTGGASDRLSFYSVMGENDPRVFAGVVHLIAETGASVISDIDDTIKVSEVTSKEKLLANTFLNPFQPVEGMAAVYQSWAKAGAQFHYVSACPWQLYAHLADFILANDFPPGTFQLKEWRWKDCSFFSLFESPDRFKYDAIIPILKRFPQRRFILVGDSGEKDPEAYAYLTRKFPKQVARILIRDVTNEAAGSARYQKVFKGFEPSLWKIFKEPKEIEGALSP